MNLVFCSSTKRNDWICRNVSTSSEERPSSPSPRCLTAVRMVTAAPSPLSAQNTRLNIITRSQNVTRCRENISKQPSTGGLRPALARRRGWSRRSLSGDWRQSGAGWRSSPTRSSRLWSPRCSPCSAPPSFTRSPCSCPSKTQAGSNPTPEFQVPTILITPSARGIIRNLENWKSWAHDSESPFRKEVQLNPKKKEKKGIWTW